MRAAVGLVLVVLLASHATARTQDPCPAGRGACGTASGDGIDVTAGGGSSSSGAAGSGGSSSSTYEVVRYAPTCTANSRQDPGALCGAAVSTCPDPGEVAYWKWTATFERATGALVDPPGWVQVPGTFCLSPAQAGLAPGPTIAALVATAFARMPLPRGVVVTSPRGQTLAQYDTTLSTATTDVVLPTLRLLGRTVRVRAHAQRFDWSFGDGQVDLGEGSRVQHTYRQAGTVQPYVVITWAGTFTVDGGPVQQVAGTATTTGPRTSLVVREARAELVVH